MLRWQPFHVLDSYSNLIFLWKNLANKKGNLPLADWRSLVLCDSNLPPRLCQALLRKLQVEKFQVVFALMHALTILQDVTRVLIVCLFRKVVVFSISVLYVLFRLLQITELVLPRSV